MPEPEGRTPPIRAIGFDLGDTLLTYAGVPLDWSINYRNALERVAGKLGVTPDSHGYEEATSILLRYNTRRNPREAEVSASSIFEEILRAWKLEPSRYRDPAVATFFDYFQQQMCVYPDSLSFLRTLKRWQVRIGILTDVPYGMPLARVQNELRCAQMAELVDVILTSVEIGWRKPRPEGFRTLATQLAVDPTQMWYVGNEQKDILGATRLGMTAVLVDREKHRPKWGQHHPVDDLTSVAALLDLTAELK
jgi:putative hydrolase of the HAD superfamily